MVLLVPLYQVDTVKTIALLLGGLFALEMAGPAAAQDGGYVIFDEPSGGGVPARATARFTPEQLNQLQELRTWLAQRKQAREQTILRQVQRLFPNTAPPLHISDPAESRPHQVLTPLGQRYSLGFQNRRTTPAQPARPPYATAPASRDVVSAPNEAYTDPRWAQSQGSGYIKSGNRMVRIGTPAVPQSEALPDGVEPETED